MRARWMAVVGLAAAANFSVIRAETPSAQLEKGIFQQETAGDLDAAVRVYKQIVDEANAARHAVAEAQFRIGACYQKQGKKSEAEAAFRQVVALYPDQVELVAKARKEIGEPDVARAPKIVSTSPVAFDNNVSPVLGKITVTFDRKMTDGSWSWTGGGETFPKVSTISYDKTKTTCTLLCVLQPGKVYWVGINSRDFHGFVSADGQPASWYVILFTTQSADGKPTPIPADLIEQAKAINSKVTRPLDEPGHANPLSPDEVNSMANIVLGAIDVIRHDPSSDSPGVNLELIERIGEEVRQLRECAAGTPVERTVNSAFDNLYLMRDAMKSKDNEKLYALALLMGTQREELRRAFGTLARIQAAKAANPTSGTVTGTDTGPKPLSAAEVHSMADTTLEALRMMSINSRKDFSDFVLGLIDGVENNVRQLRACAAGTPVERVIGDAFDNMYLLRDAMKANDYNKAGALALIMYRQLEKQALKKAFDALEKIQADKASAPK